MTINRKRDNLIRFKEVKRRTSLASSTVYRRMDEGTFPQRVKLSIRCVAWYESDIDAWVANPSGWRAKDGDNG